MTVWISVLWKIHKSGNAEKWLQSVEKWWFMSRKFWDSPSTYYLSCYSNKLLTVRELFFVVHGILLALVFTTGFPSWELHKLHKLHKRLLQYQMIHAKNSLGSYFLQLQGLQKRSEELAQILVSWRTIVRVSGLRRAKLHWGNGRI